MTCLAQVNDVRQGSSKLITAHDSVLFKDRKSTRLNSSHSQISYAVFCLKKKNTIAIPPPPHSPKSTTLPPGTPLTQGAPAPHHADVHLVVSYLNHRAAFTHPTPTLADSL